MGGKGSGHYGHKGRKGRRGGSAPGARAKPTSAWSAEEFDKKILSYYTNHIKDQHTKDLDVQLRGNATEVNPDWPANAVGVSLPGTGEIYIFTTRPGGGKRSKGQLMKWVGHEIGHNIGDKTGIPDTPAWKKFADPLIKQAKAGQIPEWLESATASMRYEKWKPGPSRHEVFAAAMEWRLSFPSLADDIPASGRMLVEGVLK